MVYGLRGGKVRPLDSQNVEQSLPERISLRLKFRVWGMAYPLSQGWLLVAKIHGLA